MVLFEVAAEPWKELPSKLKFEQVPVKANIWEYVVLAVSIKLRPLMVRCSTSTNSIT